MRYIIFLFLLMMLNTGCALYTFGDRGANDSFSIKSTLIFGLFIMVVTGIGSALNKDED